LGLVQVKGPIEDSRLVLEALDEFTRDDAIKAIVLRVDSPGGGVGPSQEIFRQVQRAAAVKPVVASMGSVAASGGYYVSAPCTRIVANPGTITGSIGVIAVIPDLENLLDKLGVKLQTVRTGELKGAGLPNRPLNEAERRMLAELNQDLYQQFLGDVIEARKLANPQIQAIKDSRVVSGRRALELGLVDQLGNYNDAVALAASLGKIEGRPQLVEPEAGRERLWRRLLQEESLSFLAAAWSRLRAGAAPQYLLSLPGGE
jgi:protease-4